MVSSCALCGASGVPGMRSFPANSLPHKQRYWIRCLNLLEEEMDRLLQEYREKQDHDTRIYWCPNHFDGAHPDPMDRRVHQRARSSSPSNLPELTRQLSEASVGEAAPNVSRTHSGSFPLLSRTATMSTLPERQTSHRSDPSYTLDDDLQGASQDTNCSTDENRVPILPEFLLVSSSSLLELFNRCPSCGQKSVSNLESFLNGSALVLKWKCHSCLHQTWKSQSELNGRYYTGNIKFAVAAHTTGLPLARVTDFATVMDLPLPSTRTFHNYLTHFVLPAVDEVYVSHMRKVHDIVRNLMKGRGLNLTIDGRYCSVGFCATNCTVTFIDLETGLVIMVINLHKGMPEINGVSGRMEKEGVKEGLKRLIALQFKIGSVCSDNDAKIAKMLREDDQFKAIKHLLDFWHLIKGINRDLREIAKLKSCPNIQYWRKKIINHAYYVHYKYGRSRGRGLKYWMSTLAHVTGRHKHFSKIPFLHGITKCKHRMLGPATSHLIARDSVEYQKLKGVIMKPTFLSGFLRASPKANTSPNECYNSLFSMYNPKTKAISPPWYEERTKLVTLHSNTLALLNMLNMREEKGNTSVRVIGREGRAVKRKMAKAEHTWRTEVWEAIPGVIEGRKWKQYLKRIGAPSDRDYLLAQQEEEEENGEMENEEEEEEGDGAESDMSEELGEDYGPVREEVYLSEVEDEDSTDDEDGEEMGGVEVVDGSMEGEDAASLSSGSEWDEGDAEKVTLMGGGRGRGRGRGRGGRGGRGRGRGGKANGGKAGQPELAVDLGAVEEESAEVPTEESNGGMARASRKKNEDDEDYQPPSKKGKGQRRGGRGGFMH